MSGLRDIAVPLKVVLGKTRVSVEEFASIGPGTVVELSALAGAPVDLLAAGRRVARGEVVVVDERFGLRVTEIVEE